MSLLADPCVRSVHGRRHHRSSAPLVQVGWVIFDSVKEYKSKAEWETDTPSHCVPADLPYSWNEGEL